MIIGFTGTREGLSNQQLSFLVTLLDSPDTTVVTQVHHGACVGADASVHEQALEFEIPVHVWPPTNAKYIAVQCLRPHRLVTVHPYMGYLDRDREIVGATQGLVALPKQDVQPERMLWGGTWYTVDFAQRMNRPVIICYPNGVVEQRLSERN